MLYRQEASPNKSQPKLFHLITIWMGPAFVSFSLHQFPAHLEARGCCSHGEVLDGRYRETRSREAAGRRNWPEAGLRKTRGEERRHTARIGMRSRLERTDSSDFS